MNNRTGRTVLLLVAGAFMTCGAPERQVEGPWRVAYDASNVGVEQGWFLPGQNRDGWQVQPLAGMLDDSFDGVAWYAALFSWNETTDPSLVFDPVDDDAEVWVNGIPAGSHEGHAEPFVVSCPPETRGDSNLLVIRVTDRGGPGGMTGMVKIVPSSDAERYMRSTFADMQARTSPDWVTDAVIYEVYLRSFSPEGTFGGLERRLSELRDLGVTVLWLMPIHPVGELNRKGSLGSPYAVQNYRDVNPEFGTKEDFRRLVDSAHRLGLKVIIDFVANHTSWDNELIISHPEWYTRDADGAIVAPNDDWSDVADLNYDHHELRKYMVDVLTYWIREFDIDGYRCDVAELVPTSFWEHARHEIDKIKPVMMLAEASSPELHVKAFDVSYAWTTYDILPRLLSGNAKAGNLTRILQKEPLRYPRKSLLMRFHTNHDKNFWDGPAIVRFGEPGVRLASTFDFVLPGVPLIYNGEEAGNNVPLSHFEKVPIDWGHNVAMRGHFKTLTKLREEHPWLSTGPWQELRHEEGSSALVLYRSNEAGDRGLVAAFNLAKEGKVVRVTFPEPFRVQPYKDVFTDARFVGSEESTFELSPLGFIVYVTSRGER